MLFRSSAMEGYLTAARDGDYERAAHYLDLSRVPEERRERRGPELARQLKRVLDRTLWVDLEALIDLLRRRLRAVMHGPGGYIDHPSLTLDDAGWDAVEGPALRSARCWSSCTPTRSCPRAREPRSATR